MNDFSDYRQQRLICRQTISQNSNSKPEYFCIALKLKNVQPLLEGPFWGREIEEKKCEVNINDEPSKTTRLQREMQRRLVETIHYLESRDEFWKYMN